MGSDMYEMEASEEGSDDDLVEDIIDDTMFVNMKTKTHKIKKSDKTTTVDYPEGQLVCVCKQGRVRFLSCRLYSSQS